MSHQSSRSLGGWMQGTAARLPRARGKRGRGRRRWVVPTRVRVWLAQAASSVGSLGLGPWLECRKVSHWEVRQGSLGEGLFHYFGTAGLDEQRPSTVLELYCRTAEGQREGKRR